MCKHNGSNAAECIGSMTRSLNLSINLDGAHLKDQTHRSKVLSCYFLFVRTVIFCLKIHCTYKVLVSVWVLQLDPFWLRLLWILYSLLYLTFRSPIIVCLHVCGRIYSLPRYIDIMLWTLILIVGTCSSLPKLEKIAALYS